MKKLTVLIIAIILQCTSIKAQHLFVDQADWHTLSTSLSEDLKLKCVVGDSIAPDSTRISYFFQDEKLAIDGQFRVDDKEKHLKYGIWKFYYPSGKIQSEREYDEKGALSNIKSLFSPSGENLALGFPHRNTNKTYYGHLYRYDAEGELSKVVRYSRGFLVDEFESDKYTETQLKRSEIRQYVISEDEYLDELSFNEAIEAMKTDPKPMLIRATYNWNGWSKKMNKIYAIPEIAKLIKDNYHLVYFNLADQQVISFEHNGETLSFDPDTKSKHKKHALFQDFFKVYVQVTPTYLLVDTDLNLIATSTGASITKEKCEHHLRYFIDGHYSVMTYKEYNPDKK